MKKKILLVALNARITHSNLAIRYLRTYCQDLNYNFEMLEGTINQRSLEVLNRIYLAKPDVVALSVYIWNNELCRKLLSEIKKILPQIKLVLGGPEVSHNPEIWLNEFPAIDWIICGKGEAGFRFLLANDLQHSQKIIKIDNPQFSEIPFPYIESDFPELDSRYIYYESSCGCPFKCSYCLSARADHKLQFKPLQKVLEELLWLIKKKPRIIKFVDRSFNADPIFARNIWQFLIESKPQTRFHFELHPALLDDEDFSLLSTAPAGLFQFEIGIQSTNPDTLAALHRQQDWHKTRRKIKQLAALSNIHIHLDMIVGLPFEDLAGTRRSFNQIITLAADHFQMGFLKVLTGTEMAERKQDYELHFDSHPPYQILSNKWLDFSAVMGLLRIENLLNLIYNSGKFKMTYAALINLFPDPYAAFETLADFAQNSALPERLSGWEKTAGFILDFYKTQSAAKMELIIDCLGWDWCQIAGSHYFPAFLNLHQARHWKKSGRQYLMKLKSGGKIELNGSVFDWKDINKTIFFQPSSDLFSRIFDLNKNNIYLFIPQQKQKIIIPLNRQQITFE